MKETRHNLIYNQLLRGIISGEYPPGHRFPRELDFARELGVAKVTLRTALARLESEGVIERLPRQGTFVKRIDNQQNRRILAILPKLNDITAPHLYIIPGIEAECAANNIELISMQQDFLLGESFDIANIKNSGYIGIILLSFEYSNHDPLFSLVEKSGLPGVIAHCTLGNYENCNLGALTVGFSAWLEAAKHLINMGHNNIATLVTDSANDTVRYMPREEFCDFLKNHNAAPSTANIYHIDYYNDQSISIALEDALAKNVSAILCHSDFIAIKVYDFLRKKGLHIPEDIAVMGYCGFPGSALLSPPLSTVDLNYMQRGRMAVRLILDSSEWFNTGEKPPCIELAHSVLIRKSTDKILLNRRK